MDSINLVDKFLNSGIKAALISGIPAFFIGGIFSTITKMDEPLRIQYLRKSKLSSLKLKSVEDAIGITLHRLYKSIMEAPETKTKKHFSVWSSFCLHFQAFIVLYEEFKDSSGIIKKMDISAALRRNIFKTQRSLSLLKHVCLNSPEYDYIENYTSEIDNFLNHVLVESSK